MTGVLPGSLSARDRAAAIDVSSNGSARKAMRGSGDEQLHASREQLAFSFFLFFLLDLRLPGCILGIVVIPQHYYFVVEQYFRPSN